MGGILYYLIEDDIWSYFDYCGIIMDVDCMIFFESGKFRGIVFVSFKVYVLLFSFFFYDGFLFLFYFV